MANLSRTLAETGFPTHLFFVGDPRGKGEETQGALTLHRWCQWISEYYPSGVYEGENDKVNDFEQSVVPFVTDNLVGPAVSAGKLVVVLAEEWHTAGAACLLADRLRDAGVRDRVVIFWNANNTFGFERIDWKRLAESTTITTVSRYMKQTMRQQGVNAVVIPNGIPRDVLRKVRGAAASRLRAKLGSDVLATKVARWDPQKGWLPAVGAMARLKRRGRKVSLLARGGIEPYGHHVLEQARSLGLKVKNAESKGGSVSQQLQVLGECDDTDVINIRFQCSPDLLRVLYHASDAVLANSEHEPFGLVGLETMAARGIAFTGGTGEDYAIHLHNAIVLDSSTPVEIESYMRYLDAHPERRQGIRVAGGETARRFTWDRVIANLVEKVETQAETQELLDKAQEPSRGGGNGELWGPELDEREAPGATRVRAEHEPVATLVA
jgi:glycosyltransferase involved in cell wall biosynthesis